MRKTFFGFVAVGSWLMLLMEPLPVKGQDHGWIDSVVPAATVPSSEALIWTDDFDDASKRAAYPEGSITLTDAVRFGDSGQSMEMVYAKGSQGKGGLKLFFGDSPTYGNQAVRRGEKFDEIYWRVYVKHQQGWTGGGPAKLSRATSMTSERWQQAMIAHVWSSGESLTLDPARGVKGDQVVTTRYNDFPNLKWLGNKPASALKIHSAYHSGRWICVECRAKLNTPGKSDGVNQLWLDGRLEAERTGLDWRGSYDRHGINAVFLEAYWNDGSPVDQKRWLDAFAVSTEPIGPVVCPKNPTLLRTETALPWQVEISDDETASHVVWRSETLRSSRVTVDQQSGSFLERPEADALSAGILHFVRVRQQVANAWSAWSPWHQPFRTES